MHAPPGCQPPSPTLTGDELRLKMAFISPSISRPRAEFTIDPDANIPAPVASSGAVPPGVLSPTPESSVKM
jgi:hypothetical protein